MRFVFLHSNFPAQFVHLASYLAQRMGNQVVFITGRKDGEIPGVCKVVYEEPRSVNPATHHYLQGFEKAVLQGQAVYRELAKLRAQNFWPDVIYGHAGWGLPTFAKEVFPQSKLICLFEWFYRAHGSDADFDPAMPLSVDDELKIRVKNAPILLDLDHCDWGVSPTYWQHRQFPLEYQPKISIVHEGIDTEFIKPKPGAKLILHEIGIDLSDVKEIVTYVARGMEPYRGFPQFIEAVRLILEERPQCHVVIVGDDRVAYGKPLAEGRSYKTAMLEKVPLDMARIHFTGLLRKGDYLKVLQASSVHVYLTYPFVLSWSMLEAMAAGCVVVASDTSPVVEVISDSVNGLQVSFFSPQDIAAKVVDVLAHPGEYNELRLRARKTILERYALHKLLPIQMNLLSSIVTRL
ncbi:glycosyltransferase family 4 protein [Propionispora hippei]|uniref:Glycosyltransferase involved in cell wall bisynthesis n=1 Tax=Propionispora hippei DSM 15287 TaxID=1123003 RepID=A0A1M6NUZ1_9FIRM|nr:glycosyltransferase family 4 protein [Propionispora hippei]SHJ99569.1 Glycosyltransferase involved in cell wall bisynthesis [Propionispora hippei DSM 15287]